MSEKQALIEFHGYELLTIRTETGIHVVMKYIVEAMGLDWSAQSSKLKKQSKKFNYGDIAIVAKDGKTRDMGGIPLRKLTGWLFTINPENIENERTKDKVEIFQEECFHVLHQHWFGQKSQETEVVVPKSLPEALRAYADQVEKTQQLESKIEADKPKVEFAEHMEESEDSISIAEFAKYLCKKGYETGQNRLFQKFRDLKYFKQDWKGTNIPYQRVIDYKWFEFKPFTKEVIRKSDNQVIQKQCSKIMVTGKGQVSITKILLRELGEE